jgi:putative methyltransferase (TIGR04325 family)
MNTRELVKLLIPPLLVQCYRALRSEVEKDALTQEGLHLSGDYPSWDEALAASTGYDSGVILERTKVALLKVKKGDAAYERDSVLFDEIQYAWPLLAGLMWVAAQSGGKLNVLDFGGSLGSTYFQNRCFLQHLQPVRWNIVEQPQIVKTGKECFEDEHLRFYESASLCFSQTTPNALILSGVLQYLKEPYNALKELSRNPIKYLILDRTPFWEGPTDRLCVQQVPPSIYPASYPAWIFSRSKFLACFKSKPFLVVAGFQDPDRLSGPVPFNYEGMIMKRSADG